MRARRRSGFSLIELLVALVIVGVVLGAVLLSSGGSVERTLQNAAERAEMLIVSACERAVVTGVDVGFRVEPDALRFGYLRANGWQPLGDDSSDELRPRVLAAGVTLKAWRDGVEIDPGDDPANAHFACLASGELTPFELSLAAGEQAPVWHLSGRIDGSLQRRREGADAP